MARRKGFTAAVGAGALCLGLITTVGSQSAGATSTRSVLAGTAAPAAERAHPAGAVSKASQVSFELALNLRNPAGAQALVKAVSDPASPSYRHFVTAAQWEAQFSPTAAQVSAASSWLKSEGFSVGAVSKDRTTIAASGTAARVESAFGASLGNYRVNGHVVRLSATDLSVPSSLAGTVAGTLGINQYVATPDNTNGATSGSTATTGTTSPYPPAPSAFVTAPPCSAYYGQKSVLVNPPFGHGYPARSPYQVCGYTPPQLRSAYGVTSADTGKGVTVAVIDAYDSATIAADATQYFAAQDPTNPFSNAHFTQVDTMPFDDLSLCAASGWLDEQAIDVESVHGLAPDANVLYVGAQDCVNGLFNSLQNVIDNRMADVVTNSWGDDAGDLFDDVATRTAYDNLFMLADATGMSVQFSSGDNGDNFNLFGISAADYPPSSPYVTSVGGTSLQVGSGGTVLGDLGWATGRSFECTSNVVNVLCYKSQLNKWLPVTYDGGSGGFTSYNYTQPYYQAPVVPSSLALRNAAVDGSSPMRVEPDISLDADPSTGFLIGLHETFLDGQTKYGQTRYGGTSLASPILAGVIADVDANAKAAGGSDVGFLNPALYTLNGTAGAITDIVPGGKQSEVRVDHAFTYIPGDTGFIHSFRELTYEGQVTYCDETGNCASRPNTLSTAKGYDSMTGLGAPGPSFIADLAKF